MRAPVLRVRGGTRDQRPPRTEVAGASVRRRGQAWCRAHDTPPPYRQRPAVRRSHTVLVSCQRLAPSVRKIIVQECGFTLKSSGLLVALSRHSSRGAEGSSCFQRKDTVPYRSAQLDNSRFVGKPEVIRGANWVGIYLNG